MTDLRRFSITEVEAMAYAISVDLDDFTAALDQLETSLHAFKFRGTVSYWTIGPRSRQWYRYTQVGWQPGIPPANLLLERPEELKGWIVTTLRREPLAQSVRPDLQVSSSTAFLLAMVQETRQAYDRGEISSTSAESSITGFYLLERHGHFWMPGVRSGSWYLFDPGRWNLALNAPSTDTLLDLEPTNVQSCPTCGANLGEGDKFCRQCGHTAPVGKGEVPDQVSQAVAEFIQEGIDVLPEPVTEAWSPPAGFPELIRQCPVCGKSDVGNQSRCLMCQSPLPLAIPMRADQVARPAIPPIPPPARQSPPADNQSRGPFPDNQSLEGARARRSGPSGWLWVLGGGCGLVLLCAIIGLLIAGFAFSMDSAGYNFDPPW